jgi:hypothetical protein
LQIQGLSLGLGILDRDLWPLLSGLGGFFSLSSPGSWVHPSTGALSLLQLSIFPGFYDVVYSILTHTKLYMSQQIWGNLGKHQPFIVGGSIVSFRCQDPPRISEASSEAQVFYASTPSDAWATELQIFISYHHARAFILSLIIESFTVRWCCYV